MNIASMEEKSSWKALEGCMVFDIDVVAQRHKYKMPNKENMSTMFGFRLGLHAPSPTWWARQASESKEHITMYAHHDITPDNMLIN